MIEHELELPCDAFLAVEPPYFRIATTYEPAGIVRERAFCYELYHQIRLRMRGGSPLSLNGEIDKRGHIEFRREDQKNPDFVFHIPRTHAGNTLVVEVKGTLDVRLTEIVDDLNTLVTFVDRYRYEAGVFLLYNHSYDEFSHRMRGRALPLAAEQAASSVIIMCMKQPQSQVERHMLSDWNRAGYLRNKGEAK